MNPEEEQKKMEEAQVAQAVMMLNFKSSQEYAFFCNILKAKKIIYSMERKKALKTQSMRETCLYWNGKEDAVDEFLEAIDQTIVDGDNIRMKNELIAEFESAKEG